MTAHIFVLGFVQGVGFRRFIKNEAKKLVLSGWVKNMVDGRVEILAQGSKDAIDELVKRVEKGNIFSDVKDTVVNLEEDSETLTDFSIKF